MSIAVVVAGSGGIGREIARHLVLRGDEVLVGGSNAGRAAATASELGSGATGLILDLANPSEMTNAIAREVGQRKIDHLVMSSVGSSQFQNSVLDFDVERAERFVKLKLIGYVAAIAALEPLMSERASVVVIGGQGRDLPYPGSTMVTAINGAIAALVASLAIELAPRRVNAVHPGVVGDSTRAVSIESSAIRSRVLTGELVTVAEVATAVLFLLDNQGVNRVNLAVDGGWLGA